MGFKFVSDVKEFESQMISSGALGLDVDRKEKKELFISQRSLSTFSHEFFLGFPRACKSVAERGWKTAPLPFYIEFLVLLASFRNRHVQLQRLLSSIIMAIIIFPSLNLFYLNIYVIPLSMYRYLTYSFPASPPTSHFLSLISQLFVFKSSNFRSPHIVSFIIFPYFESLGSGHES